MTNSNSQTNKQASGTNECKQCPFCGSKNLEVCSENDTHGTFYYVFCGHCEACGPTDYDRDKVIELWDDRRSHDDYLTSI